MIQTSNNEPSFRLRFESLSVRSPLITRREFSAPDVIVVFHDALTKQDITIAGMKEDGYVIYNGQPGDVPDTLKKLPKGTKIVRIDATNIAMEEFSRANAVLLGTLCEVVPFLEGEHVLDKLTAKFKERNPKAAAANERAFERGATEYEILEGVAEGEGDLPIIRPTPILGYETAPIGGIIPNAGNTISNDLSASRTGYMPKFAGAKCIHCGLCATVCPDFCLSWTHEPDEEGVDRIHLKGIDYQYCKGCMRCVETCPTEAMVRITETPGLADSLRVPLYASGAPAA